MRYSELIIIACITALFCAGGTFSEDSTTEQERLGLSQSEYLQYKESGMNKDKVADLLTAGIQLSEYFKHHWDSLGTSESNWISMRKQGFTDEEIKSRSAPAEFENKTAVLSFFLPGYGHWKRKEYPWAALYTGIAVTNITLYAAFPYKDAYRETKRNPLFLILLFVDMSASAFHIYRETRYDENPDAKNFSLNYREGVNGIGYTYTF